MYFFYNLLVTNCGKKTILFVNTLIKEVIKIMSVKRDCFYSLYLLNDHTALICPNVPTHLRIVLVTQSPFLCRDVIKDSYGCLKQNLNFFKRVNISKSL